jgi:chemotaxis protein methyltransferase CheR
VSEPLNDTDFQRVRTLLRAHAGIELGPSKYQLVFNRLAAPIRRINALSVKSYLDMLENNAELTQEFINALTTNVTAFFREPHHFITLIASASKPLSELRVWSAGCSTGQEPYSIAIALAQKAPELLRAERPACVLATDIDTNALSFAKEGKYREDQLKGLSKEQLLQFFDALPSGVFQVKKNIRRMVEFKALNLNAPTLRCPWHQVDAVFCRNVMIYFGQDTQRKIIASLLKALNPNGILFSGHSEMLLHSVQDLEALGQTAYVLRSKALTSLC